MLKNATMSCLFSYFDASTFGKLPSLFGRKHPGQQNLLANASHFTCAPAASTWRWVLAWDQGPLNPRDVNNLSAKPSAVSQKDSKRKCLLFLNFGVIESTWGRPENKSCHSTETKICPACEGWCFLDHWPCVGSPIKVDVGHKILGETELSHHSSV